METDPLVPRSKLTDLFTDPEASTEQREEYLVRIAPPSNPTRRPSLSLTDILSTITGSCVFVIYHVVFCLAQASTVAPHASVTGGLARTAALGVLVGGPTFIVTLGRFVPAMYPASDLFLAPFLSQIAEQIDASLDPHDPHYRTILLTTLLVVSGLGMLLAGVLCVVAARFSKLANLGAFLPYAVLCGFFTTIGVLMWTLGFSVDTGLKIGQVVALARSGEWDLVRGALFHHTPSLVLGVLLHVLTRMHSSNWVIGLILCTIVGSYGVLCWTDASIEEAQMSGWFFAADDLVPPPSDSTTWAPPLPLGVWWSLSYVSWKAVRQTTPTMLALVFLYLIRCSLHAAALKKNSALLVRPEATPVSRAEKLHRKREKERVLDLGNILEQGYGYSQIVAAVFGGIAVAPSVAASVTLFRLGAEKEAPQYGSCLLLAVFYFTDFRLVQFVCKPAFSCLMVLAGLDMCRTWIYDSFFKTKDKLEWLVAPTIVLVAFSSGVLNSILLGVALSCGLFVARFYHAGTVKCVASGLTLRSTVERGPREAAWLDQNADHIQVLVLQNYLFFGNAQSVLTYVMTMFDDDEDEVEQGNTLPPIPKYLIIDFSICTGMDTSAVDLFREIASLCREHGCELLLSGARSSVKLLLTFAGVSRSNDVHYLGDLEIATARAEDGLLSKVLHWEEETEAEIRKRSDSLSGGGAVDGFLYALRKIDEMHGVQLASSLEGFRAFTNPVQLTEGEVLVRAKSPGVYFVETGALRVKPAASNSSMSLNSLTGLEPFDSHGENLSIGHLNARNLVRRNMERKEHQNQDHAFRLARIGQGWVIGSIEETHSRASLGVHVAISDCRLHHLPHGVIQDMETKNPSLCMNLYKLLSLLATKRQESTIHQLDQFVKIMNAPVPRLRGGKGELAKLHIA